MIQFGLFSALFVATAFVLGKYLRFRFVSSEDSRKEE